jgi:hypothetical protein
LAREDPHASTPRAQSLRPPQRDHSHQRPRACLARAAFEGRQHKPSRQDPRTAPRVATRFVIASPLSAAHAHALPSPPPGTTRTAAPADAPPSTSPPEARHAGAMAPRKAPHGPQAPPRKDTLRPPRPITPKPASMPQRSAFKRSTLASAVPPRPPL